MACTALLIGSSARLLDAALWRVEQWQSTPNLTQRIFERRSVAHQLNVDRLVPSGAILFFGDSHLQTLPVGGLAQAYNFAIGGETAERLSRRLGQYTSLHAASAVVIGAGTNDLAEGRSVEAAISSWNEILRQLPASAKVVCVDIPVNRDLDRSVPQEAFNRQLAQMCAQRGYAVVSAFQGDGQWVNRAFSADGVHLDGVGSVSLLDRIKRVLQRNP